jgi:nucleolar complex protein 2
MASKHQKELKRLAKTDPEFHAFLQRQGPELLDFEGAATAKGRKAMMRAVSASKQAAAAREPEEEDDEHDDDDADDAAAASQMSHSGDADSDSDAEEPEDDEDDSSSSDEDEGDDADTAAARAASSGRVLSARDVEAIAEAALTEPTQQSVRELVHALRAAAATATQGGGRAGEAGDADDSAPGKYTITSVTAYHRAMVAALRHLPRLLIAVATAVTPESSPASSSSSSSSAGSGKRSRSQAESSKDSVLVVTSKTKRVVRAALGAVLRLIPALRSRSLVVFLLRSLRWWIPLFAPFPKHVRALLKALLEQWGSSQDGGVQLVAFLRLRQCALEFPLAMVGDRLIKGLYVGFLRAARALGGPTSSSTSRHGNDAGARLALMGNCVVEAAALHPALTYRHAFVYVRQLAVHLRAALTSPTSTNRDKVLRWQFVSALRVWGAVLRAAAAAKAQPDASGKAREAAPLDDLLFPVIQVCTGVLRLAAGPSWHPLRLQVVETLISLQWATEQFVPCGTPLLEVLGFAITGKGALDPSAATAGAGGASSYGSKKRFGGRGGPAETAEAAKVASALTSILRLPNAVMATQSVRDALLGHSLRLLADWLRAHHCSPAFPELAGPVLAQLRSLSKLAVSRGSGSILAGGVGSRWRAQIRAVVQSTEARCLTVAQKRASVTFAPSDTVAAAGFLREERVAMRAQASAQAAKADAEISTSAKRAALQSAASDKQMTMMPAEPVGTETSKQSDADSSSSDEDDEDDDEEDAETAPAAGPEGNGDEVRDFDMAMFD